MRQAGRKGVALVEVLVSVAILGLALAPVVGMMHKSYSAIRQEKDEAQACAMAGQLLNQVLFEIPYNTVVAAGAYSNPGPPPEQIFPTGTKTLDGTQMDWDFTVTPMPIKFLYRRYKYHTQHSGAMEPVPASLSNPALFYADPKNSGLGDPLRYRRDAVDIDSKFGTTPVLCEIELKIRWRPPGATTPTKEEKLYVRRAKLD